LVGKAYEIRWQLQRLMETAKQPHEPLIARLSEWRIGDRRMTAGAKVIPFPVCRVR
jgi:hypothetical protein